MAIFGEIASGPPPAPTTNVQFTASSASIGEGGGAYTVTVYKTLAAGDVSGQVQLGGTATLGADYSIDTTNFTMNGAVTSATFVITIVDDEDEESSETVVLTLANVVGGSIGSPSVFTLTITDNDSSPPPAGTIVINFEGAGETKAGYAAASVTLSGLSWELAESLIGTSDSDRKNGARSARLRTNDFARMTLLEDLTNGVGDVSFLHAKFGNDGDSALELLYSINSGSSWVSAGTVTNTSTNLTLFTTTVNQPGNVRLRITKIAGNAASRASVDDITIAPFGGPPPPPPTNVQFTASSDTVDEDVGTYTVTVFKSLASGDVGGQVHLGGTATLGADYTIDTTNFTMNGAVTSATFVLTIIDDSTVELTETIVLTLTNVTGGTIVPPSVFTLSILDNDTLGPAPTTNVWINEVHYDNTGTDVDEGVEIAGPADTDLTGYSLWLYDGGTECFCVYSNVNLTGVIPDQMNGFGTLWFPIAPLQNGPDGIALVYNATQVIQFISYEGSFTVTDGPAAGMASVDIGVFQPGTGPVGQSLQLCGSGTNYGSFAWSTNRPHSRGLLNECQTIPGGSPFGPAQTSYIITWWGSIGAYTGNAADDDGDGFSNLEEFIAGTIPVPPSGGTNFFRAIQIAVTNAPNTLVSTPGVTGRLYRLWTTPTLVPTQNWSQVAGPLAGAGGTLALTNSASATTGIFRLTVELENP